MSNKEHENLLNQFLKDKGWNLEVNLDVDEVDVCEISDKELLERVVELGLSEYDIRWEGCYQRVLFQELNERFKKLLYKLGDSDGDH